MAIWDILKTMAGIPLTAPGIVPPKVDATVAPRPDVGSTVPTSIEPDLQKIVQERALALLSGKGGGGGGKMPEMPKQPMDYSQLLGVTAGQEVPSGTPRTTGMTFEESHKEWEGVSKAIDQQMDRYLSTGGAANAQQQQTFENALKVKQMQNQASSQHRQEIAQYLSLAHQMSTDKRQQEMLGLQLKREERALEKHDLEMDNIKARTEALRSKAAQTKNLGEQAVNLREFALNEWGSGLPAADRAMLAQDEGLARHLKAKMDILKSSMEVVTEPVYLSKLQEAYKEYIKNPKRAALLSGTMAPATPAAQVSGLNDPANIARVLEIFSQVGAM